LPESKRHLELRVALYQALVMAFGDRASIGSEQPVCWDPTDPAAWIAPSVFVRLGEKDEPFDTWRVWERGAPHVAVHIVRSAETEGAVWEGSLAKYRRLGVREVVRFDPDSEQTPLGLWDALGDELLPRNLIGPRRGACAPLALDWVVVDDAALGRSLRLADPRTWKLLPTPFDRAAAEAASRMHEAEARIRAERDRDAALGRVRSLERALGRRG
jgi:hypothetical protein